MDEHRNAGERMRAYYDQIVAQKSRVDALIKLTESIAVESREQTRLIELTRELSEIMRHVVDVLEATFPDKLPANYRRSTN